ncbi:hypothetical protein PVAP13_5NG538672 [Panicum virgatum]|uniref:Uncharacterized protein n=1 Tax=Panicum virgatum TaxID=38727 RepID=A0A8T0S051_PANVG|nr:hypothetical protein PVAP13_5NG538672 [Panicum virgatum]
MYSRSRRHPSRARLVATSPAQLVPLAHKAPAHTARRSSSATARPRRRRSWPTAARASDFGSSPQGSYKQRQGLSAGLALTRCRLARLLPAPPVSSPPGRAHPPPPRGSAPPTRRSSPATHRPCLH